MSGHLDVLNDIPKVKLLSQNIKLDFKSETTERALGLLWDIKNDKLAFQYSPKNLPTTKQGIICLGASIFYPFGIVTPADLVVKLKIQSLWKSKID